MSDLIQLLPEHIANQIAAGEVVQRPASVVKELLENAIDAGAQNIRLIVKDAGKSLIQVVDDGIGMSETDARMSFERHATSKIRTAEDLFHIRTMGFRGEALASIAAVAQVELRTRRREQELGTRIVIEGSEILAQEPCQTAVGTSMSVKNLFFNIPARRNFLKSNQIEMQHIVQEFERVVLANPDIFFSLHHNDEKMFHLPKANMRQRIVHLLGNKINQALIPVGEETDVLKIHGFVTKPEYAKKTRGEQFFFVNNRFIKSNYLHHAVMNAYEDVLPSNQYPLYVIFLELDPARIDVNVHPTKQEIKFDDERLIYNYLRVTTRHALAQHSVTPSLDFESDAGIIEQLKAQQLEAEIGLTVKDSAEQQQNESAASKLSMGGNNATSNKSGGGSSSYSKFSSPLEESNLRNWQKLYESVSQPQAQDDEGVEKVQSLISNNDLEQTLHSVQKQPYQVHQRYIVSPIKSGFMLIDQQAAHQRILYEEFLQKLNQGDATSQQKLFPQVVTFSTSDAILLREMLPVLQAFGVDIKEFSKTTFIVHGMPSSLEQQNEQKVLEALLEQYKLNIPLRIEMRETIARSFAQQSAVPAGKLLTPVEMQQIIDRLFACEVPYQAPNGRKTFITYELEEINQRFEGK